MDTKSRMRAVIVGAVATLALAACDCPIPETWNGRPLVSEFGFDWTQCGVYEDANCSYTVCQEGQATCDWQLDYYYCW